MTRAHAMLGLVVGAACAFAVVGCDCGAGAGCSETSCPRPSSCRAGVCVPPTDAATDVGGPSPDAFGSFPDAIVVVSDAPARPDAGEARATCDACTADAECGDGAVCVRLVVGGSACMPVCDPDLPDCPRAFTCVIDFGSGTMAPHCAPVGGLCCVDEDADEHGLGVACEGNDCDDADPAVHAGAVETCNGRDDDCDTTTDEALPDLSCGLGECAVTVPSCAAGVPATCVPTAGVDETCNGLDDDCDGMTDESLGTLTCGSGACIATIAACVDGVPATCMPGSSGLEACNGIDDDCDGATDEGLAALACGVGACAASAPACVGGVPGTCRPGTPRAETCNGVDDDCDLSTDEDLGALSCGVGACAATAPACVSGVAGTCTPGTPRAESCNGIDDDCDLSTDEDLGTLSCGTGACASTAAACVGGMAGTCTPGAPRAESCNGIDDDCDGRTDEGADSSCPGAICVAGGCQPAGSCRALLAAAPGTPSGTYAIDPDGLGGAAPFDVYCDMASAGGGWTLILMAADSPAGTFGYDATMWTDGSVVNPTVTDPTLNTYMKSAAFDTVPLTEMRMCLGALGSCLIEPITASSAGAVFSGGEQLGALGVPDFAAWGYGGGNGCNRIGFNVYDVGGGAGARARCRYGILLNNEAACEGSVDGGRGLGCRGYYATQISAGQGDGIVATRHERGWIFVR